MKKILSFLLVLACLIPCAFATGCGNKIKLDTKYYFKGCEAVKVDEEITEQDLNNAKSYFDQANEGVYVVMYKDNKAKMFKPSGEVLDEMTYSVDKDNIKFTVDGDELSGKIDGKKVSIEMVDDGIKIIMTFEY